MIGGQCTGKITFVVGSGPSARESAEALAKLLPSERRSSIALIAVNDAYRLPLPWNYVYGSDYGWWRLHWQEARACRPAILLTCDSGAAREYADTHVPARPGTGWPSKGAAIYAGSNSGYAAAQIAIRAAARRIVLLGMDCQPDLGGSHFFGEHPPVLPVPQTYLLWIADWAHLGAMAQDAPFELLEAMPPELTLPPIRKVTLEESLK